MIVATQFKTGDMRKYDFQNSHAGPCLILTDNFYFIIFERLIFEAKMRHWLRVFTDIGENWFDFLHSICITLNWLYKFKLVAMMLMLVSVSISQPNLPRIGQYQLQFLSSNERNLAIRDGHAFVTGWASGLTVIDFANRTSPSFVASINSMGMNTRGIALTTHYAFVTNPDSGVYAIDISRYDSMRVISYLPLIGACRMKSLGIYAYVAAFGRDTTSSGLYIIDISNPNVLVINGFVQVRQIRSPRAARMVARSRWRMI